MVNLEKLTKFVESVGAVLSEIGNVLRQYNNYQKHKIKGYKRDRKNKKPSE